MQVPTTQEAQEKNTERIVDVPVVAEGTGLVSGESSEDPKAQTKMVDHPN